jgi:hypothetical protein
MILLPNRFLLLISHPIPQQKQGIRHEGNPRKLWAV